MNTNNLQDLKFDTTRQVVITTRGEHLPVKVHSGWKYVNYNGIKIGLSKISVVDTDPVFEYVFNSGHIHHHCPAMDYWILRHRLKVKITPQQYKTQYLHR